MKVVVTGSLGNIGKPLTEMLIAKNHSVNVISSSENRKQEIEALGAKASIGSLEDVDFLTETFRGADAVFCMEAVAKVEMSNPNFNIFNAYIEIAKNYVQAAKEANIKKVVHLSSIGAHAEKGFGSLNMHYEAEKIMKTLPEDVNVKFLRPVGFYSNLYRSIQSIKEQNSIISNYGGDTKEPWVSPKDIAAAVLEEIENNFTGKTVRYVASDNLSPNEIAEVLGQSIAKPDLKWVAISDEQMLQGMLSSGMNEKIAEGFVEMQAKQGTGEIFEDYNLNKPVLGTTKFAYFAVEFANSFNQNK